MRGVPQSGLWSEEEVASSGTGSERAQVASVADAEAPREPGSPVVGVLVSGRPTEAPDADRERGPRRRSRIWRRAGEVARLGLGRQAAAGPQWLQAPMTC